jgi:hypothetical protein
LATRYRSTALAKACGGIEKLRRTKARRCKMSTPRGFLRIIAEDGQSVMLCSPVRNVVTDTVERS